MATVWSVWTFAEASASLETSRLLSGPAGVWKRMQTVSTNLHTRPVDNWTRESPGLGGLVRYVFECTADTDRLLVTWFAPEVFFQAERAFAVAAPAVQRAIDRDRARVVAAGGNVDGGATGRVDRKRILGRVGGVGRGYAVPEAAGRKSDGPKDHPRRHGGIMPDRPRRCNVSP